MALTGKQQAFIAAYLVCRNATEAAKQAGYAEGGARQKGYENMHNPEVKKVIEQHFDAMVMTAGEVISLLGEQARADYAPYITIDETTNKPVVDVKQMIADGKAHLIKSIKYTRNGVNVEFHDAESARKVVAQIHGLTDRGRTEDEPTHQVQWTVEEWKAEQEKRRQQAAEAMKAFEDDE